MKGIKGFEHAVDILGSFSFGEFDIVRELRFWYNPRDADRNATIEMTLESSSRAPNYAMRLRFSGVSSFRVKDFGSTWTSISGFHIVDIADRQWEDVRWEVEDYENDDIGFYCRSIEIVSVIPLGGGVRDNGGTVISGSE